jgi:ketosteroid isomerase-like protein
MGMSSHEQIIRTGYQAAEGATPDVAKFLSLFADDGVICDVASGTKFRGPDRGLMVTGFATAFPDMHREIYGVYETGNTVVVELSLNGTHNGPLVLPAGTLPPTGKEMHAPCCDVFHFKDGKIQTFNCYAAGTIMFMQLGVLANLGAALKQ